MEDPTLLLTGYEHMFQYMYIHIYIRIPWAVALPASPSWDRPSACTWRICICLSVCMSVCCLSVPGWVAGGSVDPPSLAAHPKRPIRRPTRRSTHLGPRRPTQRPTKRPTLGPRDLGPATHPSDPLSFLSPSGGCKVCIAIYKYLYLYIGIFKYI